MKKNRVLFFTLFSLVTMLRVGAQKVNDVNTPLNALKPAYEIPYGIPDTTEIKGVLNKIYEYLNDVTPAEFVNRKSQQLVTDLTKIDTNTILKPGDFRITSYEWGVTYSGMLRASQTTGDNKFAAYTKARLSFLANSFPFFKSLYQERPTTAPNAIRSVVDPHALDDAGAVCASMIKLLRQSGISSLRAPIDNFISFITTKEFRLPDRTLARNRPLPNTLWLDDLYMSVPALAQMGALTGDKKYYDDAIKQVTQFSSRMFNQDKGLYMHGWVQDMTVHPQFHWARANGWAFMAMAELLDALPENYPGRKNVLAQFQALAAGLARYQSGRGFWHQLIDRDDSYLETSATAIYTFCFAKGINKGWLDAKAYTPACLLGWNAVSTKVNNEGGVEGTCVGTGMAFDPAFYYYRPTNVYAAHGYGPVLLAGAEVLALLKKTNLRNFDSAVQVDVKK